MTWKVQEGKEFQISAPEHVGFICLEARPVGRRYRYKQRARHFRLPSLSDSQDKGIKLASRKYVDGPFQVRVVLFTPQTNYAHNVVDQTM